MKGDFSRFRFDPSEDHQGLLFQQGRIISDADLSDGEAIALNWRLTAGRDIIGPQVAAVPASEPDGYRVTGATVAGSEVLVDLDPGRIWADGLHTRLTGTAPVVRRADYLPEPQNPAGTGTGSIAAGVRDAVILEVSLEALNGFQLPDRLIEPALGGPDTAERIIPHTALRLLRLGPNEDCSNIGGRLEDGPQGHLTVSLEPATVVPGDCPVVEGGGYSGFEHNLYRIEIAETGGGPERFKWSQFNGGLVGRGLFHGGADPHVAITANRAAILHSGLKAFYLEALVFDDERGHWRVVYGTPATLNADDEIDLAAPPTFGTVPGAGTPVFFRLWNEIEDVASYTDSANPVELRDGIRLVFDAAGSYRPGSYWTFDVRAGEISNPQVLLDDVPPAGPRIRRVPLAEITWGAGGVADVIEDCRRRFRPLTNQQVCCTYRIGNGVTCFGDFNSLEEGAAHLPATGGRLCLLQGVHRANLELAGRVGIHIEGCRHRTFLLPRLATVGQPIVRIEGGRDITISEVDLIAPFGIAIDAVGNPAVPLRELLITGCRIMALTHGIQVEEAEHVRLLGNQIWLLDHPLASTTIAIRARDGLIEKNRIGVWPFEYKPPRDDNDEGGETPDPSDPCIEPEALFANVQVIIAYVATVWAGSFVQPPTQPYRARGGIHVRGSSERIDLRRNRITGGLGHGITLGGVLDAVDSVPADDEGGEVVENPQVTVIQGGFLAHVRDSGGVPMVGFAVSIAPTGGGASQTETTDETGNLAMKADDGVYGLSVVPGYAVASIETVDLGSNHVYFITVVEFEDTTSADEGFITQIRIIDNQITQMGLSGVGFWFYDLVPQAGLVAADNTVEGLAELVSNVLAPRELLGTVNIVRDLVIRENRIEGNLQAVFNDLLKATALFVAQGGISLGIVEGARIEGNQITGNGVTAANPCAGIFVGYGEEVQISDNQIAGNGPVLDRYRELRVEGLRGGIFVRMAAAVVAGGADDGIQKPALLIRDNVIDQPAGRAITALAYGPISVVGNTLNAEYEGAWSVLDTLVGGMLILNLGGIHRLLGTAAAGAAAFDPGAFTDGGAGDLEEVAGTTKAAARYATRVEAMLPGGETLVNSNRLRTGPDNLSWSSTLVATADDLGFDANQSGTFRPDVTFANLVAVAHSLRVTDNRFRERARYAFMSALTLSGGATSTGGARSMNMTSQNQGDHCIVAVSTGAIPVVDTPNQVVFSAFCPAQDPQHDQLGKGAYVIAALLLTWRASVQPDFEESDADGSVTMGLNKSIDGLQQMQMGVHLRYTAEAQRYTRVYGAENSTAKVLRDQSLQYRERANALTVQGELTIVKEVAPSDDGSVLDGRVSDNSGRAVKGQIVEVVDQRGRPIGFQAETDGAGYYAFEIDTNRAEKLAARKDLFLRVTDTEGQELSAEPAKLVFGGEPKVRTDLRIAGTAPIFTVGRVSGTEIFRDDSLRTRPTPVAPSPAGEAPVAPEPAEPAPPPAAAERVPLERVVGVGDATAMRLRKAGVTDANQLAALSEDDAKRILGAKGIQILRNARTAVEGSDEDGN